MRTIHSRSIASVLAPALLASAVSAGNVLKVAPSGAAYTDIQSAVSAALDGDTILVASGNYAAFIIGDRSLVVVGDAGATVNVEGSVKVGPVAASRTVVLIGLPCRASASVSSIATCLAACWPSALPACTVRAAAATI